MRVVCVPLLDVYGTRTRTSISLIKIIIDKRDMYDTAKATSHTTYYHAIKSRYGSLSWHARMCTGLCHKQARLKIFLVHYF